MIASEIFEEGEQPVGWPIAPGAAVGWGCAVKRALLDREIGVQVNVRGSLLLVAESQGDRGGIDAGAEQHHRGGVAQRVHRHLL